MKIQGNEYLFGRCLKITIAGSKAITIEHAPEINRDLNLFMDVSITDRPSATAYDNPGFQGTIKIYNPGKRLLEAVLAGATWVQNYLDENGIEKEKFNAVEDFYNSRSTVTVEAGYIEETPTGLKPMYHTILKGYLNGSSYERKGVDNVLTLGVMDMDLMRNSKVVEKQPEFKTVQDYLNEQERMCAYETTWYQTVVKIIKMWETERLPNREDLPELSRSLIHDTSTVEQQINLPTMPDQSKLSYEEMPFVQVSEVDRMRSDWFEIRFVESLNTYFTVRDKVGSDYQLRQETDAGLQAEAQSLIMPVGGYVTGSNLAQMLDSLCAHMGMIGWYRDLKNTTRNRYIFYRLGNQKAFVPKEQANIRIWNYQNLLESPSVSGSGIMTVKMVFNPECQCLKTIALVLDKKVVSKDGVTRDLNDLENGLIESVAAQSSLATYGNVQINGANAVAAANKSALSNQEKTAKVNGYLFNTGFPIISVKHELSTYGKNWTTTITTSPVVNGFQYAKLKKGE